MVNLVLENLNCTHCAGRIETAVRNLDNVKSVTFNFINKRMDIDTDTDELTMLSTVKNIVDSIEDGVNTKLLNKTASVSLVLENLNCSHCAARIEAAVRNLDSVNEVSFNFINKRMDINTELDEVTMLNTVKSIVDSIEDGVNTKLLFDESDEKDDKNFIKKAVIRLVTGGIFILLGAFVLNNLIFLSIPCYIIAYIIFGYDVIIRAVKNIAKGQVFDENFLMSIATVAAIFIGEFSEAVAVMLFYQIGEFLQDLAVDRSKRSIKKLMSLNVETVDILENGTLVTKKPEEIKIGDIISVKPGEKICVDGVVMEGNTTLDMRALTGESLPVSKVVGDRILSGSVNEGSVIYIKAEKLYEDSTVSKILDLVENAAGKKSKTESFITKFAAIYTPAVVIGAVLLAVIPTILGGQFVEWLYRALVFLVASCPCALVVSIPLTFFSGIGALSKKGVLVKGSNYLQLLAELDAIAMDKTGTITKGHFNVTEVSDNDALKYAASLEQFSTHPIAKAITDYYNGEVYSVKDQSEISGYGVTAEIEGKKVAVGNLKLMEKLGIVIANKDYNVYVAVDNKAIGFIRVEDSIKSDSCSAVNGLKSIGIKNITMLTGDKREVADNIGLQAGIDNVYSELLPQDKVNKFEELCSQYNIVAAVGDGINDAPLLARADVGVAMGGIGSDAAIEAADIVIMDDMLSKLVTAVKLARYTLSVCKQNVVFVVAVKLIVLVLAAFGVANMWLAVFADVGTALLAVLNAVKIMRK